MAVHFLYCNLCLYQTLGVTPAMQAGLPDHVWSIAEAPNAA